MGREIDLFRLAVVEKADSGSGVDTLLAKYDVS